jgi:hypothetical protein
LARTLASAPGVATRLKGWQQPHPERARAAASDTEKATAEPYGSARRETQLGVDGSVRACDQKRERAVVAAGIYPLESIR